MLNWRLGLWHNSADHEHLDSPDKESANYGIYIVLDGDTKLFRWSHRLGFANDETSAADQFIALAVARPLTEGIELGVGFAHTFASNKLPDDPGDQSLIEIYFKKAVKKSADITVSIQYFDHSGLTVIDSHYGWVGSVRLSVIL